MSLTHELIKELIEDKVVTAVYGGGFKPPTAGHLLVVQKALEQFPEIDKFIIYVGGGVRDEIDQEESLLVWNIYKKLLPSKVEIQPSKAPIGDILRYAKNNPEEIVYFVIGARENNEGDLADIAARTTGVEDKYSNLKVKVIQTPGGGMSGTNARKALTKSPEDFYQFLPQELPTSVKSEIYNILRPAGINEDMSFEKKRELIKKIIMLARRTGDLTTIDKLADMIAKQIEINPDTKPLPGSYKVIGGTAVKENINFTALEKVLDDMFDDLDIDINFTKHFKERVIERGLTEEDIIDLMSKIHDRYGDEVADLPRDENRVFTHLRKLVDIAAVAGSYGDDYLKDLILKTAYKRSSSSEPEFKTNASAPKLAVTENTIPSIDIIEKCAQLSNHMIEKGYNIKPLPAVEFISDDIENAEDFLGKTAYYDPNEKKIVLYTAGRHPKDIVRSYAHEMIHHMQNLEGRLGAITTTDTTEDDHLNNIEAEANLKGTMSFRNWTDSLQENKDPFGLLEGLLEEGVYDSVVSKLAKDVLTTWKSQFDENPKRLFAVLDTTYELEDAKGRPLDFTFLAKLDFKKTKDRNYKVDGGANEGDDETEGFVALNFTVDPRELPRMWSTIAMDIRDVLRHELEHLTQGGWNERSDKYMEDDQFVRDMIDADLLPKSAYFQLEKEVDAMLQGLYYKAKKSRTPFKDVIDAYLNTQPLSDEDKETILTLWRKRNRALSLPLFEAKYKLKNVLKEEETEQKYKIYCDMDGVLTDFDEQFKQLSGGVPPGQYEETNGKKAFWTLVDGGGVGFWVGMPWMPNGKKLWDYISKYNPTILSAPSSQNESRLGKRLWVRNNLSPKPKLILASAQNKQNYSGTNRILIDDRPSNVEQWRSQGGIGILFVSTEQAIKELEKLGL